jgi:hypothetical protein
MILIQFLYWCTHTVQNFTDKVVGAYTVVEFKNKKETPCLVSGTAAAIFNNFKRH